MLKGVVVNISDVFIGVGGVDVSEIFIGMGVERVLLGSLETLLR